MAETRFDKETEAKAAIKKRGHSQSHSHSHGASSGSHSAAVKWQVFSHSKRQWLTYARNAAKVIEAAYQSGHKTAVVKQNAGAYIDFTSKPHFSQRIEGNEEFTRAVRRIPSGTRDERSEPFAERAAKNAPAQRASEAKGTGQQKPERSDPDSDELEESGMARYPADFAAQPAAERGGADAAPPTAAATAAATMTKKQKATETAPEKNHEATARNDESKQKQTGSGSAKAILKKKQEPKSSSTLAEGEDQKELSETVAQDGVKRDKSGAAESEEDRKRRRQLEEFEDQEFQLYFDEFVKSMGKENPYIRWSHINPVRLLGFVDADLTLQRKHQEKRAARKQKRSSSSSGARVAAAAASRSGSAHRSSKTKSRSGGSRSGHAADPNFMQTYAAMLPMFNYHSMAWMAPTEQPQQPWGHGAELPPIPFVDAPIVCPLPLINLPGESSYLCFCTKAREIDLRLVRARDGRAVRQKPFFAGQAQGMNLFALKYRHSEYQSCASFEYLQRPGDASSKRRVEIITVPTLENGLLLLNAVTGGGGVPTEIDNVILMHDSLRTLWHAVGWDRGPDASGQAQQGSIVPLRSTKADLYSTSEGGVQVVPDDFLPTQARIIHTYLCHTFPDNPVWW